MTKDMTSAVVEEMAAAVGAVRSRELVETAKGTLCRLAAEGLSPEETLLVSALLVGVLAEAVAGGASHG